MNSKCEVEGVVAYIGEIQEFPSGFRKRLIVIDNGQQYSNLVPLELMKDNVSKTDGHRVGERVIAKVDVGGREYDGKYYPNLTTWFLKWEQMPSQGQLPSEGVPDDLMPSDQAIDGASGHGDAGVPF